MTNFSIENDERLNNILTGSVVVESSITLPIVQSLPTGTPYTAKGQIAYEDVGNGEIIFFNGTEWQQVGGGSDGPLPITTQILYVNNGGNDTTGNGTIIAPYATITHAMSTITDALWEKRYVIYVGPGNWSDNFAWKAWVYINGANPGDTRLTGTITINDPTWANPGSHSDERSGASDLTFAGTLTLDFTLAPSPYGKFFFWNCNMNNILNMTGESAVNQVYIWEGDWFGGIAYTGINLNILGAAFFGGSIAITGSSTSALLTAAGGYIAGTVTATWVGGNSGITIALMAFPVTAGVTASGSGISISATGSSLPIKSTVALSGGATLTYLNDAFGLAYTPTTPSDWSGNPTSLQNAIDRMASLLYTLNGSHPIP